MLSVVNLSLFLCELLVSLSGILHSGQLGVAVDGRLQQHHGLIDMAAGGRLGLLH